MEELSAIAKAAIEHVEYAEVDLVTMASPHAMTWNREYPSREKYGFAEQHGWACGFKNTGFRRLVSRRWLEFGPWKTYWRGDDLCVVQFHSMKVDALVALEQAVVGHRRMGISDMGGVLREPYIFSTHLEGAYLAAEQRFDIPVAAGTSISELMMRDACALRLVQGDKPIKRVSFTFATVQDASLHLHELWLRELECRALIEGRELRLDGDYRPTPIKPAWVDSLSVTG